MSRSVILILDSAGEMDFILPFLLQHAGRGTRTLVLVSASVYHQVESSLLVAAASQRIRIRSVHRAFVLLAPLLSLMGLRIWLHFSASLPPIVTSILRIVRYRNLVAFPHTAFYYYPNVHRPTGKPGPRYAAFIPVMIQLERYTPNLKALLGYRSFCITGMFHDSRRFKRFLDSAGNARRDWPSVVILSYYPREGVWTQSDFTSSLTRTLACLSANLPTGASIGVKFHPRAERLPHQEYPDSLKVSLETESVFLLARNAQLVIGLGPSASVYAASHMGTDSIVYYGDAPQLRSIRGADELFDPAFEISMYEDLDAFESELKTRLCRITHHELSHICLAQPRACLPD